MSEAGYSVRPETALEKGIREGDVGTLAKSKFYHIWLTNEEDLYVGAFNPKDAKIIRLIFDLYDISYRIEENEGEITVHATTEQWNKLNKLYKALESGGEKP